MKKSKKVEKKEEAHLLMLEGENLQMMKEGYVVLEHIFEELGADKECPTFEKFCIDSMTLGAMKLLAEGTKGVIVKTLMDELRCGRA